MSHNTLVSLQRGKLSTIYSKVPLHDAFGYRESERVVAAEPKAAVVEVDGYTVGLQTCYDLRFPESSRVLVDTGADVLAIPAEWFPGPLKEYHWSKIGRASCRERQVVGSVDVGI